jgi:hypothetical protein
MPTNTVLAVLIVLAVIVVALTVLGAPGMRERFRGRTMYVGVSQDPRVYDYADRYPNVPEIT